MAAMFFIRTVFVLVLAVPFARDSLVSICLVLVDFLILLLFLLPSFLRFSQAPQFLSLPFSLSFPPLLSLWLFPGVRNIAISSLHKETLGDKDNISFIQFAICFNSAEIAKSVSQIAFNVLIPL